MKTGARDLPSTAEETTPGRDVERLETDASSDASTRDRVARSILEHGPSTASTLAVRLGLTPAAVRRHLGVLSEVGHLEAREERVYGNRGRGRPAKVFFLTDAGRGEFFQAYDRLAIDVLDFLSEREGPDAVKAFSERAMAPLKAAFPSGLTEQDERVGALVKVLNEGGYVASLRPVPSGQQLCQYHCPVAHVASVHTQLCAAETLAFSQLLGSHVQRIATIAHGDGVCTTHIPYPIKKKVTS